MHLLLSRAVGHNLVGLYLQAVGLHKLSIAHYRRSVESEKTCTAGGRSFLVAALAEMSTHSKIGLSRASDLLHEFLEQPKQCQNEDHLSSLVAGASWTLMCLSSHGGRVCIRFGL